ncbi:uncharacterized protein LOC117639151 [Thrips palmi]|uniref:Uncharacterized protein LOC117639151 n=1 Tax=Thrips palmi TaxID=161013 RepID=A0A6P8Y9H5_THRPL|nr:uncharacterized protein LOC117639151 [Thrips palmi]
MNGSRIWVDLSALFSCSRKQSCIFVDHEKFRTVGDVEEHICRLFSLKQAIHIQNDGWLLPSSESSLLLRDNDIVSVVPEDAPKISQIIDKTKDALSALKSTDLKDLCKPPSKPVVSKTDMVPPKSVVTNGHGPVIVKDNGATSLKSSIKNPFAVGQPPSLEATKNPVVEQPEQNGEANETLSTPPVLEGNETASEIGSESKKRKRIRRRKKKSATDTTVDENTKETKRSQYIQNKFLQSISYTLSTVMGNNTPADVNTSLTSNKKRKHIFFDDPEEKVTKKILTLEDTKVVERPPIAEEPEDVKISSTEEPTSSSHQNDESQILPSISSPALDDGALGLAKLMSLSKQKSPAVFERKKAEKVKINEEDTTVIPQQKTIKLTPLNDLPVKETIIQFQILKMCNYSPVVSAPIKARVISPDAANKQIYVQILEGLDELQTEKGKFSLDLDECLNDDVSSGEYLYLDWQELLEPKAVNYV